MGWVEKREGHLPTLSPRAAPPQVTVTDGPYGACPETTVWRQVINEGERGHRGGRRVLPDTIRLQVAAHPARGTVTGLVPPKQPQPGV